MSATSLLFLSLPVRGAWVEMKTQKSFALTRWSRSPCGERGLKLYLVMAYVKPFCRSPCGERGLKYLGTVSRLPRTPSLPVRGAWVEIAAA